MENEALAGALENIASGLHEAADGSREAAAEAKKLSYELHSRTTTLRRILVVICFIMVLMTGMVIAVILITTSTNKIAKDSKSTKVDASVVAELARDIKNPNSAFNKGAQEAGKRNLVEADCRRYRQAAGLPPISNPTVPCIDQTSQEIYPHSTTSTTPKG